MIPGITASGAFISPLVTVTEGSGAHGSGTGYGYANYTDAQGSHSYGAIDIANYRAVPIMRIGRDVSGVDIMVLIFSGDRTGDFFSSVDFQGVGLRNRTSAFTPNGQYDAIYNITTWTWNGIAGGGGWDGAGTRTAKINR